MNNKNKKRERNNKTAKDDLTSASYCQHVHRMSNMAAISVYVEIIIRQR